MQRTTLSLLAMAVAALAFSSCPEPAWAQEAGAATGHELVDRIFAYLGMAVTVTSTLATVLPRAWRVTQLLARFSADLRGILTPDPSDDPEWVKTLRGGGGGAAVALIGLGSASVLLN